MSEPIQTSPSAVPEPQIAKEMQVGIPYGDVHECVAGHLHAIAPGKEGVPEVRQGAHPPLLLADEREVRGLSHSPAHNARRRGKRDKAGKETAHYPTYPQEGIRMVTIQGIEIRKDSPRYRYIRENQREIRNLKREIRRLEQGIAIFLHGVRN